MTDATDAHYGRIWFPGNAWPNGHRVTLARWTGALRPETGLWWQLHLETAECDEEVRPGEPASVGDWQSPGTWQNYHLCTLSSLASDRSRLVVRVDLGPAWERVLAYRTAAIRVQ